MHKYGCFRSTDLHVFQKISQESPDAAIGYAVCAQLLFLLHNLIRNPSEMPKNSDSNWKELGKCQ